MKKIALMFALILCSAAFAAADIRLPDTPKPTPTAKPKPAAKEVRVPFSIVVNSSVTEPVLRIPRGSLKNLRAQLDALDGGDANGAIAGTSVFSQTQTLVSGLFLSLAMIFGGVWFVRGKSLGVNQKIAAGALICLFLGASAFAVFANVAPPPLRNLDSSLFSDEMLGNWRGAEGAVKIEIIEKNSDGKITLNIPRSADGKKGEE